MATVGDLKRQGKNGLHIECSGCGYIVIAWWQTLGVPDDREVDTVISKLRCDRCGTRPRPAPSGAVGELLQIARGSPSVKYMGVGFIGRFCSEAAADALSLQVWRRVSYGLLLTAAKAAFGYP